jgi:hypothetical protein
MLDGGLFCLRRSRHRPAWFVNVSLDCVGARVDVIAAYSASAIAALTGW